MRGYETYGPFHFERDDHRVTDEALKRFWKQRKEDSRPGLSDAVGVYIMSLQSGDSRKLVPWYVGRTDKQSFKKRFSQHRLRLREVLEREPDGQLQIFLLAFLAWWKSSSKASNYKNKSQRLAGVNDDRFCSK